MQMTRLKYERIRKGWTQQELGELIGLTKSSIHLLETLKRKPSYNVLLRLRELFDLPDGDLFQQVTDEASFFSDQLNKS